MRLVDGKIYEVLKDVARRREVITYGDLGLKSGMILSQEDNRHILAKRLGDLSTYEVRHGRSKSMISAVVVLKPMTLEQLSIPGKGFFELAIELGRWDGKGGEKSKLAYYYGELRAVWDYWSGKDKKDGSTSRGRAEKAGKKPGRKLARININVNNHRRWGR